MAPAKCEHCAYDLSGLHAAGSAIACPECGKIAIGARGAGMSLTRINLIVFTIGSLPVIALATASVLMCLPVHDARGITPGFILKAIWAVELWSARLLPLVAVAALAAMTSPRNARWSWLTAVLGSYIVNAMCWLITVFFAWGPFGPNC